MTLFSLAPFRLQGKTQMRRTALAPLICVETGPYRLCRALLLNSMSERSSTA
jgi:hypothetical protein